MKLHMKETTLLKIALICSSVGLVALYIISESIELKDYKPNYLSNKNIGDSVELSGQILKITSGNNVVFIELKQEFPVKVVVFTDKEISLNENDYVNIKGKVAEYNGKEEIIADKIRIVK